MNALKEEHYKRRALRTTVFLQRVISASHWEDKLAKAKATLDGYVNKLQVLKSERKTKSNQLQKRLFEQYTFLNSKKEDKNLYQIFNEGLGVNPPSAAGECAAPKTITICFSKQSPTDSHG